MREQKRNKMQSAPSASHLRDQLAALAPDRRVQAALAPITLGVRALDEHLGGLGRATLHEVLAASFFDAPAANAFALGMALRMTSGPLIWVTDTRSISEVGDLYGQGLHEWGLETRNLLLVRVGDAGQLLAAGEEALGCGAAEAVIMSGWGEARAIGLTSSRRLAMAAGRGKATGFFVRAAARSAPSAAETRWTVRIGASAGGEAGSPDLPVFSVELVRSRTGAPPRQWDIAWDRERKSFIEPPPVSGGLVSPSAQRPAGEGSRAGRRTAA